MGLKPAFRASATLLEVSFLKAIVSSLWLKEQVEIRGSRAMRRKNRWQFAAIQRDAGGALSARRAVLRGKTGAEGINSS
jgi:hypothetical protein